MCYFSLELRLAHTSVLGLVPLSPLFSKTDSEFKVSMENDRLFSPSHFINE